MQSMLSAGSCTIYIIFPFKLTASVISFRILEKEKSSIFYDSADIQVPQALFNTRE